MRNKRFLLHDVKVDEERLSQGESHVSCARCEAYAYRSGSSSSLLYEAMQELDESECSPCLLDKGGMPKAISE